MVESITKANSSSGQPPISSTMALEGPNTNVGVALDVYTTWVGLSRG
ncbi:MAG: hypothetical protein V5A44_04925 [Haloarculaceae archaeon]